MTKIHSREGIRKDIDWEAYAIHQTKMEQRAIDEMTCYYFITCAEKGPLYRACSSKWSDLPENLATIYELQVVFADMFLAFTSPWGAQAFLAKVKDQMVTEEAS